MAYQTRLGGLCIRSDNLADRLAPVRIRQWSRPKLGVEVEPTVPCLVACLLDFWRVFHNIAGDLSTLCREGFETLGVPVEGFRACFDPRVQSQEGRLESYMFLVFSDPLLFNSKIIYVQKCVLLSKEKSIVFLNLKKREVCNTHRYSREARKRTNVSALTASYLPFPCKHSSSGSRIRSLVEKEKDTRNSRGSSTQSLHVAFQRSFHEVPYEVVPWVHPSLLGQYCYQQSCPNVHPSNTGHPPPDVAGADALDARGRADAASVDYKLQ